MNSRKIQAGTAVIAVAAIAAVPSASLGHVAAVAFFLAVGAFALSVIADGMLTAVEIAFG